MTAMAATASGLRSISAEGMGVDEAVGEEQVKGLSRGQTAAVVLAVGLGALVAGYGLAGSYVAVSELAARHDVPLAGWVPAGLDGGLVAVVVLDLVLTWIGAPVGWLRQLVRVLSVGTVVTNVIAGWPDPVAVGLHAAAPLMLLAMLEAGRSVLLRRIGEARGARKEPIPFVRWVLAPWRTMFVARQSRDGLGIHLRPRPGVDHDRPRVAAQRAHRLEQRTTQSHRGEGPMNDNTDNTENAVHRKGFRVLDFEQTCPDCGVAVGEAHIYDEVDGGGCDVARCLVTGLQRIGCDAAHDCGCD
jgi:hypothetical protein